VVFRCVLQLVSLRPRSEDFKELEIVVLRHELSVLRRQAGRPQLTTTDRVFLAAASQLLPPPRARVLERLQVLAAEHATAPQRCRASVTGLYLPREVFFGRLGFAGAFLPVCASDFSRFFPATSGSFRLMCSR